MMIKLIPFELIGLLSGFLLGMFGLGWGALSVPILTILGMDPTPIIALSLLARTPVALVAGVAHWKIGHVKWKPLILLLISGTIGALIGALLSLVLAIMPSYEFRMFIGYLTVLMGLLILVRPVLKTPQKTGEVPSVIKPSYILIIGLFAGLSAGTVGFGWGPIGVSLLMLIGVSPQLAIGCSLLSGVAVSLSGGLYHYAVEEIALGSLIPFSAFGMAGALLGVFASRKIPPETLRPIIAILLIILGATARYAVLF